MRLPKLTLDPLATAFAVLAAVLLVVFLVMLGATQPRSRGTELPFTTVQRMATAGQVRDAVQLDYDHRLLVNDRSGKESWTSYPASGALQDQLLSQLSAKGANVVVDSQSGKQAKRLIVQVLLPILILAALFALFMRLSQQSDAGGMGAFSRWSGRQLEARARQRGRPVVRRRRRCGQRGRRAAGAVRPAALPGALRGAGRAAAEGRAARRPARYGQDAAGARDGGRGARRVLLRLRRRVRGVAGRRGRRAHPRPVRQGPRRRARDRVHRRARRRRPQARRRRRPGQRRARADAQPAARRDGRLRRRPRPDRPGGHEPPGHPGPRAAAPRALRSPDHGRRPRPPGADRDPRALPRRPPVRRRRRARSTSPAAAPASPAPSSRTSSTRRRCSARVPASA